MGDLAKFGPELFFLSFWNSGSRGIRVFSSIFWGFDRWPKHDGVGWLERGIIDQVQLFNLFWSQEFLGRKLNPHLPFFGMAFKMKTSPHKWMYIIHHIFGLCLEIPRISPTRSQNPWWEYLPPALGSGDLVEVSDGRVQEGLAKACLHERTPRDGLCARWWRWSLEIPVGVRGMEGFR